MLRLPPLKICLLRFTAVIVAITTGIIIDDTMWLALIDCMAVHLRQLAVTARMAA